MTACAHHYFGGHGRRLSCCSASGISPLIPTRRSLCCRFTRPIFPPEVKRVIFVTRASSSYPSISLLHVHSKANGLQSDLMTRIVPVPAVALNLWAHAGVMGPGPQLGFYITAMMS